MALGVVDIAEVIADAGAVDIAEAAARAGIVDIAGIGDSIMIFAGALAVTGALALLGMQSAQMGPPAPPSSQPAEAATQPAGPPPRVGVFTFSAGFKHDVLELAEKTIGEIAAKSGAFEAVLFHQYRQGPEQLDLSMISREGLKGFDAVLFYTTSGEKDKDLLTAEQRDALMERIRGGMAFIGVHSATDTFYDWPEYGEMIGAYFDGHPWTADSPPVTIKIEDPIHPATIPLGSSWFLQEEIYQFKAPYDREKLHVLMSLDTDATNTALPGVNRTDGDFAVAWSKYHGEGRVFYTALGHREDVWRNELFRQHLLGGIRWALGLAKGRPESPDAAPEEWIELRDGLKYRELVVGEGEPARHFMSARIHYTGWLADGTQFDSSYDKGEPLEVPLGRGMVIRGWDEGIVGMKPGGKRRLLVPPALGYGVLGSGDKIPPNATLLFEVELVGYVTREGP